MRADRPALHLMKVQQHFQIGWEYKERAARRVGGIAGLQN